MVPQKKLALFDVTPSKPDNENEAKNNSKSNTTPNHQSESLQGGKAVDVDALTDQLADFRSFGATLSSKAAPLTTSVGSGG